MHIIRLIGSLAAAVAIVAIAQATPGEQGSGPPSTKPSTVDRVTPVGFKRDVLPLLQTSCVACHQRSVPSGALSLEPVDAYASLVGIGSSQIAMMRVAPRAPDKSYLMYKLLGTHASVLGSGNMMPIGQPPLMESELETIRTWIAQGAKNN
jgi:hypothetical protein